jgi:hypothetical protein
MAGFSVVAIRTGIEVDAAPRRKRDGLGVQETGLYPVVYKCKALM